MGIVKNKCDQSGDGTLKLTVSEEWTDGITNSLHVDSDSQKLKTDNNFFWVGIDKSGCGESGHGL